LLGVRSSELLELRALFSTNNAPVDLLGVETAREGVGKPADSLTGVELLDREPGLLRGYML
jgi:hypothetical protein